MMSLPLQALEEYGHNARITAFGDGGKCERELLKLMERCVFVTRSLRYVFLNGYKRMYETGY